mgnify:CR=1 FL=1
MPRLEARHAIDQDIHALLMSKAYEREDDLVAVTQKPFPEVGYLAGRDCGGRFHTKANDLQPVARHPADRGKILGAAMARALFDLGRPTVGLLNVGVEEIKGQEEVKEAGRVLREAALGSMDYRGFVEGDDIGQGSVDVIVVEGFAGNIALKTAEGTARQIGEYLRDAMSRTLSAKLGYLLAKGAFDRLREKMDVRKINGGVFLGLNGIVVKSHGGADEEGFAAAVELGYDMVRNGLIDRIEADLDLFHARHIQTAPRLATIGEDEE